MAFRATNKRVVPCSDGRLRCTLTRRGLYTFPGTHFAKEMQLSLRTLAPSVRTEPLSKRPVLGLRGAMLGRWTNLRHSCTFCVWPSSMRPLLTDRDFMSLGLLLDSASNTHEKRSCGAYAPTPFNDGLTKLRFSRSLHGTTTGWLGSPRPREPSHVILSPFATNHRQSKMKQSTNTAKTAAPAGGDTTQQTSNELLRPQSFYDKLRDPKTPIEELRAEKARLEAVMQKLRSDSAGKKAFLQQYMAVCEKPQQKTPETVAAHKRLLKHLISDNAARGVAEVSTVEAGAKSEVTTEACFRRLADTWYQLPVSPLPQVLGDEGQPSASTGSAEPPASTNSAEPPSTKNSVEAPAPKNSAELPACVDPAPA